MVIRMPYLARVYNLKDLLGMAYVETVTQFRIIKVRQLHSSSTCLKI